MTWLQRYRLKRTLHWSLWLLPALSIGLVFVVAPLLRWLDRITGWSCFNFTPVGEFSFTAGTGGFVEITNGGTDGSVVIDGVRWVWVSE